MSTYTIVDLEFCKIPGTKKGAMLRNEIIEIGAVMLDEAYRITDTFKTYVSPELGTIDKYIQRLTGISRKETAHAPRLQEALEAFAAWLPEDGIAVSWSESDESQIRKETTFKNICIPKIEDYLTRWQDCQKTFGDKMGSPKHYSLSEALIITGTDSEEGAHDALVDAKNTARLFARMQTEETLEMASWYGAKEECTYTPFADLLANYVCVNQ